MQRYSIVITIFRSICKIFKTWVLTFQALRQQRLKVYNDLKDELVLLYTKLDIEPRSTLERNILCDDEYLVLKVADQEAMEKAISKLKAEDEVNTAECRKILGKIDFITRQLGDRMAKFTLDDLTSSEKVIKTMKAELQDLEVERKKHMVEFIENSKQELESAWHACYAGDREKEQFLLRTETITDDEKLLSAYEDEINKWQTYQNENKTILEKVSWLSGKF